MQLPEAFIERTRTLLKDEYKAFEAALSSASPVSVRVNNKLEYVPSGNKVSWCEDGYYLDERPLFTADPLFHGGVYYVQEASSMFLNVVARQFLNDADKVLDLCAAPGGKSTLLANALKSDALLVSNEILPQRASILLENMTKWGKSEIVVTCNKPSDFGRMQGYFDAIVVDAPCSGEGMFRKDPKALDEWSVKNVKNCVSRQREIVSSVWSALKSGGILVYSTCTFNREENEENIEWICNELGAEVLQIDISRYKGIVATDFGWRFYPHKVKGEGFFISVLRKVSDSNSVKINKTVKNKGTNFVNIKDIKFIQLKNLDKYKYLRNDNVICAYDENYFDDLLFFKSEFKCLECGITLGEFRGKDFIPSHRLALSKEIDVEKVYSVEVDKANSLKYLKREALFLSDAQTGFMLICYNGIPLGWVKNVGNRSNNLYPANWRIRMRIED